MAEENNQTPAAPEGAQPSEPAAPQPAPAPIPEPYAAPQQPPMPGQQGNPYAQPPSPYGQPAPGAPAYYQQTPQGSGKAIGALVCGIFAILLSWLPLAGIVLGVVAIVLAVKAVKEAGKDGKATGGKVCGIIGIVFSVLAMIFYAVLTLGIVAYMSESDGSSYSGAYEPSAPLDLEAGMTEEDKAAKKAAEAELDKLKIGDEQAVQQIAALLDAEFADEAGYGLSELGVDSTAMARWMLQGFDYRIDTAFAFDTGEGSVYADVTMRDLYAFADAFNASVNELASSEEAGAMDEAAAKARIGELMNAAMENATGTTSRYVSMDLVKTGNTWSVDEESWTEEVKSLFNIM